MTEILIWVESGTEAETRALYRALSQDPDVASVATLSIVEDEFDAELGPALDALVAVVDSAVALGALVVSIAAWRDARANKWTVSFEEDGVRVELQGSSDEELRRVIRELGGREGGGAA